MEYTGVSGEEKVLLQENNITEGVRTSITTQLQMQDQWGRKNIQEESDNGRCQTKDNQICETLLLKMQFVKLVNQFIQAWQSILDICSLI